MPKARARTVMRVPMRPRPMMLTGSGSCPAWMQSVEKAMWVPRCRLSVVSCQRLGFAEYRKPSTDNSSFRRFRPLGVNPLRHVALRGVGDEGDDAFAWTEFFRELQRRRDIRPRGRRSQHALLGCQP